MKTDRSKGFNLIELVIALAIVAVLSTVAYASYSSGVTKAKRAEAKSALLKMMQQEEKFFTQNNRYIVFGKSSNDPDAVNFLWYSSDVAGKSSYELEATACKDGDIKSCVLITAVPGSSNVDNRFQDLVCGNFTLNSNGVKGYTGSGSKEQCW
ncbi:type IV pilin protein [Undibacterium jejuense]|uniref:Type IV pilin protein n=1 Tax=Undibacterium jejuense TaxID=1344949 RepID=A0A923HNF9_9BURK|nr:type IV pilin protein [Undibacterium jejuense]MBC3864169.1 type IV pilin protein [Undibacterium jejuense]